MGMLSTGIESRFGVKYFNDVWRSVDGITWNRVTTNDYGIRSEHAAVSMPNGKILVQGGHNGIIFEPAPGTTHPIYDWQFLWTSTDGENWTKERDIAMVEDCNLWRSGHEMVYYKDRVWTLPGKTTSNNHYGFTTDNHYSTWTYDDNSNWAMDSDGVAIDARHSYASVIFRDKIWVIGGFKNKGGQASDIWTGELN